MQIKKFVSLIILVIIMIGGYFFFQKPASLLVIELTQTHIEQYAKKFTTITYDNYELTNNSKTVTFYNVILKNPQVSIRIKELSFESFYTAAKPTDLQSNALFCKLITAKNISVDVTDGNYINIDTLTLTDSVFDLKQLHAILDNNTLYPETIPTFIPTTSITIDTLYNNQSSSFSAKNIFIKRYNHLTEIVKFSEVQMLLLLDFFDTATLLNIKNGTITPDSNNSLQISLENIKSSSAFNGIPEYTINFDSIQGTATMPTEHPVSALLGKEDAYISTYILQNFLPNITVKNFIYEWSEGAKFTIKNYTYQTAQYSSDNTTSFIARNISLGVDLLKAGLGKEISLSPYITFAEMEKFTLVATSQQEALPLKLIINLPNDGIFTANLELCVQGMKQGQPYNLEDKNTLIKSLSMQLDQQNWLKNIYNKVAFFAPVSQEELDQATDTVLRFLLVHSYQATNQASLTIQGIKDLLTGDKQRFSFSFKPQNPCTDFEMYDLWTDFMNEKSNPSSPFTIKFEP